MSKKLVLIKKSPALFLLTAVAFAGFLARCAATGAPVRPDSQFWSRRGERIHLVMTQPPQVRLFRTGGDDLYHDLVSDERDADLIKFLDDYHRSASFDRTENLLSGLLQERGFETSFSTIDVTRQAPDNNSDESSFRLAKLRQTVHEPIVLVVSTRSWYITRNYEGVFPTSLHHVRVKVSGELLDLVNSKRLWSGEASGGAKLPRKWNEPPGQPKVRQALEAARADAEGRLAAKLGSWDGMSR